jgi:cytochrome P450
VATAFQKVEALPCLPPEQRRQRWASMAPANEPLRHPGSQALAHIPGEAGLPVLGAMPEILRDPLRFSLRMAAAYGPIYRFKAFGNWHLHVAGPDAHERVLFDQGSLFSAREGWGQVVEPLFPGALLVKDGAVHRHDRRILGEAFRQAQFGSYQEQFARSVANRIGNWSSRPIDAYTEARQITFDIAAAAFLGLGHGKAASRAIDDLQTMMAGLLALVPPGAPSLVRTRGRSAKKRLERTIAALAAERRSSPQADFLTRVAQLKDDSGQPLSSRVICDSFIFLMSAAHDTLASALTSILYFLAEYPFWAERLREELASAGIASPVEAAAASLPLMDMFYKEALRLNGPAPIIWRRATQETRLMGHQVPAGTMVGVNLLLSHRQAGVFPDPESFDPHRFSSHAEGQRSRFAYAPFGAGVHKCLGIHFSHQQVKVFMAALLQQYSIHRCDDRPVRWYHWPNARPRSPLVLEVARLCRER